VVQYYNYPGVVQVYKVTGVLQEYKSSTKVYGFFCTTWLQELYGFTVVVQYYRDPGIVQGIQVFRSSIGVHRYRSNTLV
jgi:hypothetical protein